MIRAHVSLRREPLLPGDVRRSKPPRAFQIVLTDPYGSIPSTEHHVAWPGATIGEACDQARGLIRARQAARYGTPIRRAILNPSEV